MIDVYGNLMEILPPGSGESSSSLHPAKHKHLISVRSIEINVLAEKYVSD